jgi:hypothetical protein
MLIIRGRHRPTTIRHSKRLEMTVGPDGAVQKARPFEMLEDLGSFGHIESSKSISRRLAAIFTVPTPQ